MEKPLDYFKRAVNQTINKNLKIYKGLAAARAEKGGKAGFFLAGSLRPKILKPVRFKKNCFKFRIITVKTLKFPARGALITNMKVNGDKF